MVLLFESPPDDSSGFRTASAAKLIRSDPKWTSVLASERLNFAKSSGESGLK